MHLDIALCPYAPQHPLSLSCHREGNRLRALEPAPGSAQLISRETWVGTRRHVRVPASVNRSPPSSREVRLLFCSESSQSWDCMGLSLSGHLVWQPLVTMVTVASHTESHF